VLSNQVHPFLKKLQCRIRYHTFHRWRTFNILTRADIRKTPSIELLGLTPGEPIRNRFAGSQPLPDLSWEPYLKPYTIDDAYVCVLRNAELLGHKGAVLHGNSILIDTFTFQEIKRTDPDELKRSFMLEAKRFKCAFPLLDGWTHNYFHWTLEILTKLEAYAHYCRVSGESPVILVPGNLTTWQKASLAALGVEGNRIEECRFARARCDKLVVSSFRRYNERRGTPKDAISHSACKWLKQTVLSDLKTAHSGSGERVYISREKAPSRRVRNEDEVLRFLIPYGFRSYCLEDLSFEEQVKLFSCLECVVAPHGAGLTNLVYSTSPRVIELFSQSHGIKPEFFLLTNAVDGDYLPLVCPSANDTHDFTVDLATLKKLLVQTGVL